MRRVTDNLEGFLDEVLYMTKSYSLFLASQDFQFILKGLARLLSNPLLQTYLPNSTKKIQFHQELLVLFWKLCDFNKVRSLG